MSEGLQLSGRMREIQLDASGKAQRTVATIAREIHDNWRATYSDKPQKPPFLRIAWPYLEAMLHLRTASRSEKYGLEDAQMIVLYFLSNATPWRGEFARAAKLELNKLLKEQNDAP